MTGVQTCALPISLKTGNFSNTLALNFKSGYTDQQQTAELLDSAGKVSGTEKIKLKIDNHYTLDYQGAYDFNKMFSLNFGVLNLLDEAPPFSLVTTGTNKGQQFGYDSRYYDPRGRTYYANLKLRF